MPVVWSRKLCKQSHMICKCKFKFVDDSTFINTTIIIAIKSYLQLTFSINLTISLNSLGPDITPCMKMIGL